MRKISFIFFIIFLLSGCKSKKDNSSETETIKDVLSFLDSKNKALLTWIEKEISYGGNRPEELLIKEKALSIFSLRDSISFNKIPNFNYIKSYHLQLIHQYQKIEEVDTLKIKRAESLLNSFLSDTNYISYSYFLMEHLLIEQEMLKYYSNQVSSGCNFFNQYAILTKEKDTIKRGEEYSLAVVPEYYNRKYMIVELDSNLSVQRDSINTKIEMKSYEAGGVIMIKLKPDQKGQYEIKGRIILKDKTSDFFMINNFSDNFYVID